MQLQALAALLQRSADATDPEALCAFLSTQDFEHQQNNPWENTTTVALTQTARPKALAALVPLLDANAVTGLAMACASFPEESIPTLDVDHAMEAALAPLWDDLAQAIEDMEADIVGVKLVWDAGHHHHHVTLRTLDGRTHDGIIWSLSHTDRRAAVERVGQAWVALAQRAFGFAPALRPNGVFAAGGRKNDNGVGVKLAARAWGVLTTPHNLCRLSGVDVDGPVHGVGHLLSRNSYHRIPAPTPQMAAQRGLALSGESPHLPLLSVWTDVFGI